VSRDVARVSASGAAGAVVLGIRVGGIRTGAILAFTHTLGEFGVGRMVGGNLPGETRTLSVSIYDRMQAFDDRGAGIMAATLLAIAIAALMTTTALSKRVAPRRG